jgi:predicted RNase H-like HicB family nuclease
VGRVVEPRIPFGECQYLELPGCESQGDTPDEARENLKDAFDLYVSDLLERGLPIPAPSHGAIRVSEIRLHVPAAEVYRTEPILPVIKHGAAEPEATTGVAPETVSSR